MVVGAGGGDGGGVGLGCGSSARAAGARHATHTFNAMRPLEHRDPAQQLRADLGVALDLVVHVTRLHRTAARAVDPQDHTFDFLVLKGCAQAADDVVGTGRLLVGNHAGDVDQRGVVRATSCAFFHVHQRREQDQRNKQINKRQQLEENPPTP